jgi:hypothetical protein
MYTTNTSFTFVFELSFPIFSQLFSYLAGCKMFLFIFLELIYSSWLFSECFFLICSKSSLPDLLVGLVCDAVYRSNGRFCQVDLCCVAVRHKSASLSLVSMPTDTILPQ